MKEELPLSEVESIRIIHQMIDATKSTLLQDGFLYLFWGWTIFLCSMGEYLLMFTNFRHPYITWVLMPAAGIKYVLYLKQRKDSRRVKSYIDVFMSYLWLGFVIAVLIILLAFPILGYKNVLPLTILFYGIGTFASGGALQFKILIFGGLANFPLAIVGLFASFQNQLFILAIAVVCSFIIPGYALKANFKNKFV
jgi:hypothetical protein